jgi:class 3 adenylate cyclase
LQPEHTWIANEVESIEATFDLLGIPRSAHVSAMCFLDVTGYTRLTEEQGDAAAAAVVTRFGDLVRRSTAKHGGWPVKRLGDGVMIHFSEPGRAAPCALDIIDGMAAGVRSGIPGRSLGEAKLELVLRRYPGDLLVTEGACLPSPIQVHSFDDGVRRHRRLTTYTA